jgi:hypothetical protein
MALTFYTRAANDFATGIVSWVAANYNIIVVSNTYTFSAAHNWRSDLTNEVSGTNYTAGGILLASKTASAANPSVLTSNDVVIAQSSGGFTLGRKYIVDKALGGNSNADPLFVYGAAGADFGNVAGALTLDVPASFVTITV